MSHIKINGNIYDVFSFNGRLVVNMVAKDVKPNMLVALPSFLNEDGYFWGVAFATFNTPDSTIITLDDSRGLYHKFSCVELVMVQVEAREVSWTTEPMTTMFEKAENLRVGDIFFIAWNKCVVEQISTSECETRMTFSFLKNPDNIGTIYCWPSTTFRVRRMDRCPKSY